MSTYDMHDAWREENEQSQREQMICEWDDEHRDIPTLETKEKGDSPGEETWVKVANEKDFDLLIQTMGWLDVDKFTKDTGFRAIIDQFFYIVHNRVYIE